MSRGTEADYREAVRRLTEVATAHPWSTMMRQLLRRHTMQRWDCGATAIVWTLQTREVRDLAADCPRTRGDAE